MVVESNAGLLWVVGEVCWSSSRYSILNAFPRTMPSLRHSRGTVRLQHKQTNKLNVKNIDNIVVPSDRKEKNVYQIETHFEIERGRELLGVPRVPITLLLLSLSLHFVNYFRRPTSLALFQEYLRNLCGDIIRPGRAVSHPPKFPFLCLQKPTRIQLLQGPGRGKVSAFRGYRPIVQGGDG
jgi:hypothetical protein